MGTKVLAGVCAVRGDTGKGCQAVWTCLLGTAAILRSQLKAWAGDVLYKEGRAPFLSSPCLSPPSLLLFVPNFPEVFLKGSCRKQTQGSRLGRAPFPFRRCMLFSLEWPEGLSPPPTWVYLVHELLSTASLAAISSVPNTVAYMPHTQSLCPKHQPGHLELLELGRQPSREVVQDLHQPMWFCLVGFIQTSSGQCKIRRSCLISVRVSRLQCSLRYLYSCHPLFYQSGILELFCRRSLGKPLRIFDSLIE